MSSSLKIDGMGSSSALVTWDSVSDGSVYTLRVEDESGNTLHTVDTEESSFSFQDLAPKTTYVFNLYVQQQVEQPDYYTKIRIDHPFPSWLSLKEVEVYSTNDTILPSTSFDISSSTTLSSGVAENAMNGDNTTNTWTMTAMLDHRQTSLQNYWQASLLQPTQLSKVRIYASSTYRLQPVSTLSMTKSNGEVEKYSLDPIHYQEIQMPTTQSPVVPVVPESSEETSLKPKYKSIRLEGIDTKYILLIEVRVFDGNGEYLDRSHFNFESSGELSPYTADQAMNGNTDTATYRNGAAIRPLIGPYWQANVASTAGTEIRFIEVYYFISTTYLGFLAQSKLLLTSVDGTVSTYDLQGKSFQAIYM